MNNDNTIEKYILTFPQEVQDVLNRVHQAIKVVVPQSTETMNYGIPTFKLNGKNLVHYAGYKKHIGFYPGSQAIEEFQHKLSEYKLSKGTIQFQLDQPIPYQLISEITKYLLDKYSQTTGE